MNPEETDLTEPSTTLTDRSTNDPTKWYWDFGDKRDSIIQNVVHYFPDTGTFVVTLKVTNSEGCLDTISKLFRINPEMVLFKPNAFTPNHDGTNETYKPKIKCISDENYLLLIFNRSGELVFETRNPLEGWDGTKNGVECNVGMYIWLLEFTHLSGKSQHEEGEVYLIR
jgi:gliding motility-associated-like protein